MDSNNCYELSINQDIAEHRRFSGLNWGM